MSDFVTEILTNDALYADWPLISDSLTVPWTHQPWAMEYYERLTLAGVLSSLKPAITIEVGTRGGGSLALFANYSRRAISIDIDPASSTFLRSKLPTVDFRVGDSRELLPQALTEATVSGQGPIFVFIDGDHSRAGVLADILSVLQTRPRVPLIVMGHDSFNPDCRQGMLDAPWAENPLVHLVEIDFQHGSLFDRTSPPDQMWGGLFFAILKPERRQGTLTVSQRHRHLYEQTYRHSAHQPETMARKVTRRLQRAMA